MEKNFLKEISKSIWIEEREGISAVVQIMELKSRDG